jgi:hypothetical protein
LDDTAVTAEAETIENATRKLQSAVHKVAIWIKKFKFKKMYWLLGRNSELSVHNKILLYKEVIRPVLSYGI